MNDTKRALHRRPESLPSEERANGGRLLHRSPALARRRERHGALLQARSTVYDWAGFVAAPAVQLRAFDGAIGELHDAVAVGNNAVWGDALPPHLERAESPHDVARDGLAGSGAPLPHLERLQAAFGPHDVRGVRAHLDGAASAASRALGAHGYASGEAVAFASGQPDLFTVAHEAAHVVQQRSGVALSDGLGRSGDVYERHADEVAQRVVSGQSAAATLDRMVGAGRGAAPSAALQLQEDAAASAEPEIAYDPVVPDGAYAEGNLVHWYDASELAKVDTLPAIVVKGIYAGAKDAAAKDTARWHFLSWGKAVLGSDSAALEHFAAIEPSQAPGEPILHRRAATALTAAARTFEAENPGYRFPATDVAFALRGRHHAEHSMGKLGHPLGLSIDYLANANPFLSSARNRLMMETVGQGPVRLELADDNGKRITSSGRERAVRELGEGAPKSKDSDDWLLVQIEPAFARMAQTSENLKTSLDAAAKTELRAIANDYLAKRSAPKRLASTRSALKKAEANEQRAQGAKKPDAKKIERAENALTAAREALAQAERDEAIDMASLQARLVVVLRPWKERIEAAIAEQESALAPAPDAPQLSASKQREIQQTIDELHAIAGELDDLGKVVGDGKARCWEPTVLQLVEQGFIRDDAMPQIAPEDAGGKQQGVFNAAFVHCMVRFGFDPAAAWTSADTMHFDYRPAMPTSRSSVAYGARGVHDTKASRRAPAGTK